MTRMDKLLFHNIVMAAMLIALAVQACHVLLLCLPTMSEAGAVPNIIRFGIVAVLYVCSNSFHYSFIYGDSITPNTIYMIYLLEPISTNKCSTISWRGPLPKT